MTIKTFTAVLALGLTGLSGHAAVVYVDAARGSDTGSGQTAATAVRSLGKAQQLARAANQQEDVEVRLGEGVYALSQPLVFTAEDSGRPGRIVAYRAAPGAHPIISGGAPLTGWELHDAKTNLWKHTYAGASFRLLSVDGKIATRARTPNTTSPVHGGPYFKTLDSPSKTQGYRVAAKNLAPLGDLTGVEMVVQPHWYHNRLFVQSVTVSGEDALIRFASPNLTRAFEKDRDFFINNSYHFEGSKAFLDAPDEWFLDETDHVVYYVPEKGKNPNESTIVAAHLEVLFDFVGTPTAPIEHLVVEGMHFAHTDWHPFTDNMLVATQALQPLPLNVRTGSTNPPPAAVRVTFAHDLTFRKNQFSNLSANGLQFVRGVKNSQILDNTFTEIGGNGIHLDAFGQLNPPPVDQTEAILVADNRLSRFGRLFNGAGILASFVANTTIEHNEVSDGPYIGIQLGNQSLAQPASGMKNNHIRYNLIRRVMRLQDDGAAIYTLGPQPGSTIDHNYIEDIRRGPWAMSFPIAAIYLDNDSEHFQVTDNVLINVGTPLYLQLNKGTKNNVLRRNDNGPDETLRKQAGPRVP